MHGTNFLFLAEVQVFGRFITPSSSRKTALTNSSKELEEGLKVLPSSELYLIDEVHDYKLELFPNESSGGFSLSFNLKPEDSQVAVQILDARGTEVYSGESNFEQRECIWEIREFGLSNGVYLVRVDFGAHLEVKRLIIKK